MLKHMVTKLISLFFEWVFAWAHLGSVCLSQIPENDDDES